MTEESGRRQKHRHHGHHHRRRQEPSTDLDEIIKTAIKRFPDDYHKHTVVYIKHSSLALQEDINVTLQRMGPPNKVFFPLTPRSPGDDFFSQVQMSDYKKAAEVICALRLGKREGLFDFETVDWDRFTTIKRPPKEKRENHRDKKDPQKNSNGESSRGERSPRSGNSSPPSENHKTLCFSFKDQADRNQLRNLALAVKEPIAVRALSKKNNKGQFNGFIEMESQEVAIELMEYAKKNETAAHCQWAREVRITPTETANAKRLRKTIENWGDKLILNVVSTFIMQEKSLRELIPAEFKDKLKAIKNQNIQAGQSYYNELSFESEDAAMGVYKHCNETATKGVDVKPAMHKVGTVAHWTKETVEAGVSDGSLIKGTLRISANYQNAFVSDPKGGSDFLILGRKDQNRALPGDIVAIEVKEKSEWINKGKEKQRTGKVVSVIDSRSNKRCAGVFAENELSGAQSNDLLFIPMDNRLPRLLISKASLQQEILKKVTENVAKKIIYQAEIYKWDEGALNARAYLSHTIGDPEDLSVQMDAILVDKGIDTTDWEDFKVDDELPGSDWKITDEEVAKRRDFRHHCIFTIDPETARDLDDALHVTKLDDNVYEVGVHIADVAFFVPPGGKIDKVASERCTSTYMPDRVIPMLPRRLCEQLCSLNPLVERYSFSVVFKMDGEGNQLEPPWYGRGIIKSCSKFAYENAQVFIENPEGAIDPSIFPEVMGGHTLDDLRDAVLVLDMLAKKLREKRIANGCIRIEQPKIGFVWDEDTKTPNGFFPYVRKDAHMMIEDFMLLANIAVAEKIENHYPELAFLRLHPPPNPEKIQEVVGEMATQGLHLDVTSSGTLSRSIETVVQQMNEAKPECKEFFQSALSLMTVKTMQLAKYFCTGDVDERSSYRHYALAVPLYTHFTSPIRRYADLVVHRQLAAAIGWDSSLEMEQQTLSDQANSCNEKKTLAKLAGEDGSSIYLWSMIRRITKDSEFVMDGVVTGLVEFGLEVLLYETGNTLRIYFGEMIATTYDVYERENLKIVKVTWASDNLPLGRDSQTNTPNRIRKGKSLGTFEYTYFTPVRVSVSAGRDPGRLEGKLLPPPSSKLSKFAA